MRFVISVGAPRRELHVLLVTYIVHDLLVTYIAHDLLVTYIANDMRLWGASPAPYQFSFVNFY